MIKFMSIIKLLFFFTLLTTLNSGSKNDEKERQRKRDTVEEKANRIFSCFLKKGPHIFILHWALKIIRQGGYRHYHPAGENAITVMPRPIVMMWSLIGGITC
jgi:hypothetical protein